MGATIAALDVQGNQATFAHVGDAKIYHVRSGKFEHVTTDHTPLAQHVLDGKMTPEEARNSPFANLISNKIGTKKTVISEVHSTTLEHGDRVILASDAITQKLPDEQILEIVESAPTVEIAMQNLRETIKKLCKEDCDNSSVIVYEHGQFAD